MPKKNTKINQNVHIIMQEKGGIGKSFVANMLLQYLSAKKGTGEPNVIGIDTDPSNATLAGYRSLNVKKMNIMEGNRINIKLFDELIKLIATTNNDYVVDIGSSNFIGFHDYVLSQDVFSIIESLGVKVYLHIIVVGGEAKGQTLVGLNKIVSGSVPHGSIVLWENEHFGVIAENTRIIDSSGIKEIAEKIHGGIVLKQSNNDLLGDDLRRMQENHNTFNDVAASEDFDFMEKMRLEKFRENLWIMLDALFPGTAVKSSESVTV